MANNWTFENATLEQDISEFTAQLDAAVSESERALAPMIIELLYEHIQEDVYNQYEPTQYLRRHDEPRYYAGPAIDDLGQITSATYTPLSVEVEYNPDGESDQWERPLCGDDLIRRIEQGGKWEWNVAMPKRPFMRNAVSELIEGGKAADWYAETIKTSNPDLEFKLDGNDVQRESADWVF